MPRTPLSKRVRFAVFARDGFTCRYCGAQSDTAKLVVDHITPVAAGGTNDPENLVTACEPCNAGKGARTIEQHAPTESDRLRLEQEMREQEALAEAARRARDARAQFRQMICDTWCDTFNTDRVDVLTLNTMVSFARRYGIQIVIEWMEAAARHPEIRNDRRRGMYISGCRRQALANGTIVEPGDDDGA